jgi:hypothetical protein
MPPPAPPPQSRALTSKQAKASFRARGSINVSATETKWLHRALQLEQRAERIQEAEKRRAEAAKKKKKAEQEQANRLLKEKTMLGTQRRLDRFGHKSSQLHMGRFFGRPTTTGDSVSKTAVVSRVDEIDEIVEEEEEEESDGFGDDEIDDDTLLDAFDEDSPLDVPARTDCTMAETPSVAKPITSASMLPPPPPKRVQAPLIVQQSRQLRVPSVTRPLVKSISAKDLPTPVSAGANNAIMDDLASFWDELDSSTQIARELNYEATKSALLHAVPINDAMKEKKSVLKTSPEPRKLSFSSSSSSFDLTVEDLDFLDAPEAEKRQVSSEVAPACKDDATKVSRTTAGGDSSARVVQQAPSKAKLPTARRLPWTTRTAQPNRQPIALQRVVTLAEHAPKQDLKPLIGGFSATQLESFIDDDLQLTQMEVG